MSRLPFGRPYAHITCDKCGYIARPRVRYEASQMAMSDKTIVMDEWLEITCIGCGYAQEMTVNK